MVTLSDVARSAGISIATASRVLNRGKYAERIGEATARRVRDVAERLGYVPNYHAQSIQRGRSLTIGIALDLDVPAHHLLTPAWGGAAYFGSQIAGVEARAHAAGYLATLIGPSGGERASQRGADLIRQRRLDALVVFGQVLVTDEQIAAMARLPDMPIVAIQYQGTTPLPNVAFDEAAGVALAVRHLAGAGHSRLLWVGPGAPGREDAGLPREQFFIRALWEASLHGDSCHTLLQSASDIPSEELHIRAAREALAARLRQGRDFTAIVCYNDLQALGVCQALYAARLRVPEDVSVVGFDDLQAAMAVPPLTTVSHELFQIGARAAELAVSMIEDDAQRAALRGRREVVAPRLVVRESTAPAQEANVGR